MIISWFTISNLVFKIIAYFNTFGHEILKIVYPSSVTLRNQQVIKSRVIHWENKIEID
ncbi:hypothetical protein PL9214500408 [Planktothrix tepida PCC 9214]|uniref:Transposase n=1 Tax=Planktothrix tepida PCC 9214 TaxID=671072 RepID=A0A1J1LNK0_9CYAN|nr:hypothetical protein PL9214500408 [Planktothrix tepida PCC 9214]